MKTYTLDPKKYKISKTIFPDHIENDVSILYHGTSNIFEKDIEMNGLTSSNLYFSKNEINLITQIFKKMDWSGSCLEGFNVLENFTKFDFLKNDNKLIYLAESSFRASLYTSNDFCGGETARGIRYAIKDLYDYIDDSSIPLNHFIQSIDSFDKITEQPIQIKASINIEWLYKQIISVKFLQEKAMKYLNEYLYGVIYAIKLTEKDVSNLDMSYHKRMGIIVNKTIPPDRIIAKAIIPQNFERNHFTEDKARYNKISNPHSIVKKLPEYLNH